MKFDRDVIDGHYHIFNWYDRDGNDFYETTKKYADSRNFKAVNLVASTCGAARDVSLNIMAAFYKLRYPETYIHGGLIYDTYPVPAVMPEGMDPLTQYQELMEIGFDGIKMIETKPDRAKLMERKISDELFEPFFAAMERDKTHVVWHSVDPETNWDITTILPVFIQSGWFYGDGTYPTSEELYQQTFDVLKRHPELNVTFAHFFFLSRFPQRLEEMFEMYPNAGVDLTPGREMYQAFGENYEYFRDFFIRYSDRLLYGTDANDGKSLEYNNERSDTVFRFLTTDQELHVWDYRFRGLGLDEETADRILCGNFLRRVSDKPKPINRTALKAYIEKYRHLIRNEQIRAKIDEELEKGWELYEV